MKDTKFLGDLVSVSKGKKHELALQGKPYIQIDDLRPNAKAKFTLDNKGTEVVPNDLIIAWDGANAGTIGHGLSGLIGSTLARLRLTSEDVFTSYLYYLLQGKFRDIRANCTGATIPHVSKDYLIKIPVPLPSLEGQKRIAAILDKADAIRKKRKQAIELTDQFLRSAFLDMFGDPITNPNAWSESSLENVANIQSGVTKGRKLNSKQTVVVPYMRVANVQDGHLKLDEIKEIEVLSSDVEKYALQMGDVLLTEGGDPDKLGRGAVWNEKVAPCIHQNHIFRVRPNRVFVLPDFLSALLGSSKGKKYFLRAAKQTTGIASINKTQLRGFPVTLPPLSLQHKYARLVEKNAANKLKLNERALLGDHLFHSTVQKAFQGEL